MTLGPFYRGDSPATPLVIDLVSDEALTEYATALVTLSDHTGSVLASIPDVPVADESLSFMLPVQPFVTAGVHLIVVQLQGPGGGTLTLAPVTFVVHELTGWHTPDSVRDSDQWADALHLSDEALADLLETARIQCEAYAPAVAGVVPVNYRQAQLLQARNLWQAVKQDTGGQVDGGGFSIPVYPLDWVVKGILRPKRGVPSFG